MKRAIAIVICIAAGFAGGVFWMKKHAGAPPPPAEAPAHEEAGAPKVSRDTNGGVVITLQHDLQTNMGLQFKSPTAFQMNPELKGFGRVLDPAPLGLLITELASAQAVYAASSNELARLKILEGQGNASARALQTAEAAGARDLVTLQSARERLALSWGKAVVEQKDLTGFVHALTSLEAALVRIDLPLGEAPKEMPTGARIVTLAGPAAEAKFLGPAPSVDPQMQGQGFVFVLNPNSLRLTAGQAVAGYLGFPGEPVAGVIVPREAVVRTEGSGWAYVLNPAGEAFTRVEVGLDRPTEGGWFVTNGIAASDRVVVTGAQQLLSLELKGQGAE